MKFLRRGEVVLACWLQIGEWQRGTILELRQNVGGV